MSRSDDKTKQLPMLPGTSPTAGAPLTSALGERAITPTAQPTRQLSELPKDELAHLAEGYGLDPTRYPTRQHLVAGIHERRQLIASLDRDAMLDLVRWGRRPVPVNASREQLALEIARIKTMRFEGLSQRGLVALAKLRGVDAVGDEPVSVLVRRLRKQEGLFSKLNRKRRAFIGSIVSSMIGEEESETEYRFLPPQQQVTGKAEPGKPEPTSPQPPPRQASIKDEIEESGLFGGLANRVKKTADAYLNQKLDEIEARIDRKLDEIDRRLAEWRDKEVANRIRILKITLWASVIVGIFSLIYTYVSVYLIPK